MHWKSGGQFFCRGLALRIWAHEATGWRKVALTDVRTHLNGTIAGAGLYTVCGELPVRYLDGKAPSRQVGRDLDIRQYDETMKGSVAPYGASGRAKPQVCGSAESDVWHMAMSIPPKTSEVLWRSQPIAFLPPNGVMGRAGLATTKTLSLQGLKRAKGMGGIRLNQQTKARNVCMSDRDLLRRKQTIQIYDACKK